MVFGRKRRPPPGEGPPTTDFEELVTAAEDEDIIELVDIIELPDEQVAETDSFAESEVAFDDDYRVESSEFDMSPQEIAGLLEDDAADALPDQANLLAEPGFTDREPQTVRAEAAEDHSILGLEAAQDDDIGVSEEFDVDKLIEADDTDRLIAELMASGHQEEVALSEEGPEGGVLVEEFMEGEQDLLFDQPEGFPEVGEGGRPMIDLGVVEPEADMLEVGGSEPEPAGLSADEEMARLFEAALAAEMADEPVGPVIEEAAIEEPPLVAALAVSAESYVGEEEVPAVTPLDEREITQAAIKAETQAEETFAPVFEPIDLVPTCAPESGSLVEESPAAAVDRGPSPIAQAPPTDRLDAPLSETETVFAIVATRLITGDAMAIEEEILFAPCPPAGVRESCIPIGFTGGKPEEPAALIEEPEATDAMGTKPEFSLDTFFPVVEDEGAGCIQGMELLDLLTRIEMKVMRSLQMGMDPDTSEQVHGALKEELESLQRFMDGIETAQDLSS